MSAPGKIISSQALFKGWDPQQARGARPHWSAAASLVLHLAILAAVLCSGYGSITPSRLSAFDVVLVTPDGGLGDGHPEGAKADSGRISSALPRAPKVPKPAEPKPRAEPAEPKPRAAAAVEISEHKTPAGTEAGARTEADTGAEAGAGTEAGTGAEALGHPEGLPQGSGGFGLDGSGFGVSRVDKMPRLKRKVEPRYPSRARRLNLTGRVVLKFLVDTSGRVRELSVVKAEPRGMFETEALRAVSKWLFEPAVHRGERVAAWMLLPISFDLK
ncbi:MAG: energy transducer TonB [Desulfovibrionaceae bacterium]|nr:energy transducer TonB [Desulfovibrionaceae bacterium]